MLLVHAYCLFVGQSYTVLSELRLDTKLLTDLIVQVTWRVCIIGLHVESSLLTVFDLTLFDLLRSKHGSLVRRHIFGEVENECTSHNLHTHLCLSELVES